jgi:hypothetical protein
MVAPPRRLVSAAASLASRVSIVPDLGFSETVWRRIGLSPGHTGLAAGVRVFV